jgi:hypothetical protein
MTALCGFLLLLGTTARGQENQILNSEFDEGLENWGLYEYQNTTEGFTVDVVSDAGLSGRYAAEFDITDSPAIASIGIAQSGLVLEPGQTYPIGFTARADQERGMVVLLQANLNNASWPSYLTETVELTPSAQEYVLEYTHSGNTIGDDDTETVTLYLMVKGPFWSPPGKDLNGNIWVDRVYFGAEPPPSLATTAVAVNPLDEETDVSRDVVLSWLPGDFAAEHDVYFGSDFDEVNDATVNDPVYVGRQTPVSYAPGRLILDQTYYWRIDEVNAAPDQTVFKGGTWGFTVEPLSYAVPMDALTATASSMSATQEPQNTINGSGLNENDEHSNLVQTMWAGSDTDLEPWIQYDFDQLQTLDKVHVWNHNSQTESILGFGFKEARIDISMDGESWTELKTVEIPQAPGTSDYTGVEVSLDGAVARAVKLTGLSNWSMLGLPQKGLSEVRFFAVPMRARLETPVDGTADVDPLVDLSWRPGRAAARHELYLGTDPNDPNTWSLVESVDQAQATVSLDLDRTVYWRIDEVNEAEDPAVWRGDVWTLSTADSVTVDDMESYQSRDGSWVWETWADGYDDPGNGAILGHDGDNMELNVVYEGRQSLPYYYGQAGVAISQASRDIDRDWGQHGIASLSLMFYGTETNTAGQMFVKVNDEQVATYPNGADLLLPEWQAWNIDLPASALGQVDTLTVGIEGGSGLVYIDAIRLYPAGE